MIYTDEIIKHKKEQQEKLHTFIKIITYPFIAFILILIFYAGYMKYIKQEANIDILGFRQYMVITGSMEPQYNIGDLIIIRDIPKAEIKVGDVINYTTANGIDTVTHRVIEIVEENGQISYKTKGDNNNSPDPELVNSNRVQGVLIFKISKAGTVITKILTKTGITVLALFIILSYLKDVNKEERLIARETARKMYNIPKYEENDN